MMRMRCQMERWYEQGRQDAASGLRPDPGRMKHRDGRYLEWAYQAGYAEVRAIRAARLVVEVVDHPRPDA